MILRLFENVNQRSKQVEVILEVCIRRISIPRSTHAKMGMVGLGRAAKPEHKPLEKP